MHIVEPIFTVNINIYPDNNTFISYTHLWIVLYELYTVHRSTYNTATAAVCTVS